VHWRIIGESTDSPTTPLHVTYIPSLDAAAYTANSVNDLGFAMLLGNPHDNGFTGDTSVSGQGVIVTNFATGYKPNMMPKEMMYPVSPGQYVVNLSIPFESHFNFAKMHDDLATLEDSWQIGVGFIAITYPSTTKLSFYQSVGDDFRYILWRPPPSVAFRVCWPPIVTNAGTIKAVFGYAQDRVIVTTVTTTTTTLTTSVSHASMSGGPEPTRVTHARMLARPVTSTGYASMLGGPPVNPSRDYCLHGVGTPAREEPVPN